MLTGPALRGVRPATLPGPGIATSRPRSRREHDDDGDDPGEPTNGRPLAPGRLLAFHERPPLAGDPLNGLLSLPDDRLLYLAAILRDTPQPAPALSPEEWQEFLDLLRPHGVYPLLAYRLRAWPADCRPPAEIVDYLNRIFLYAAARSMRA